MRHHPDAVMIFAAGFGTRMGELTQTKPKPLIEVAGRPLIDHALDVARGANVGRIVANTHYLADQMAAHLTPQGIEISHEPDDILETGGGLRKALPLLGTGPVFTLNSDAVWTGSNPLTELSQAWNPERMDALLLLLSPDQATGHTGTGDFHMSDTGLTRGPGLIYSGAQIVKPDLLAAIPERVFSLNLLWDRLIPAGRLHGVTHTGGWCDVGRKEGIAMAEALLNDSPNV